jgi:tryptophan 2,3-dioxygenase
VDAIRLVDKNAVDVATAQAVATATALAKTVQDSAAVLSTQGTRQAEDLRTLVATTAAEQSRNLQQQFTALTTRISALEQAGAEGKGRQLPPDPIIVSLMAQVTALAQAGSEGRGKAALQDPAISALTAQVAALLQARTNQTGTEQGYSNVIGWIVGGVGMLIAFLGMLAAFMRLRQASGAPR